MSATCHKIVAGLKLLTVATAAVVLYGCGAGPAGGGGNVSPPGITEAESTGSDLESTDVESSDTASDRADDLTLDIATFAGWTPRADLPDGRQDWIDRYFTPPAAPTKVFVSASQEVDP
ncbi:MAG: hypothetical protein ACE5EQ_09565, partial [Phycisphaerae bacterium]